MLLHASCSSKIYGQELFFRCDRSQRRMEHKTARWYSNGSSCKHAIITVPWISDDSFRKRSVSSVRYIIPMIEHGGIFLGDSIREGKQLWPEFVVSRAKSACNNGASHVNHRQTPHPRLSTPSPCVFFVLYSPSNVPRIAASPFIAFLMQLMHYGTPFRVNPTGWNPRTYLELFEFF